MCVIIGKVIMFVVLRIEIFVMVENKYNVKLMRLF